MASVCALRPVLGRASAYLLSAAAAAGIAAALASPASAAPAPHVAAPVTGVVLPGPVAPGRGPLVRVVEPPAAPVEGRRNPFAAPVAPPPAEDDPVAAALLAPPAPPVSRTGRNPFLALVTADGAAAAPPADEPVDAPAGAGADRVLGPGDSGPDVRELQERLAARGWSLQADGVYGRATTAVVTGFQRRHGLAVDGLTGPETWAAVREG